jgi:mRNA interferase MazF
VKRGDIVIAAPPGAYGKPRPVIVLQADSFTLASYTVAPFTSDLQDAPLLRVPVEPDSENGLQKPSQIMIDKIVTGRLFHSSGWKGQEHDRRRIMERAARPGGCQGQGWKFGRKPMLIPHQQREARKRIEAGRHNIVLLGATMLARRRFRGLPHDLQNKVD